MKSTRHRRLLRFNFPHLYKFPKCRFWHNVVTFSLLQKVDLTVTEAANAAPLPPKAVPRQRKKGPQPVYETLKPQCKIAYAYSNDPARSVTSSIVVRPLPETPSDEQDQQHPPPVSSCLFLKNKCSNGSFRVCIICFKLLMDSLLIILWWALLIRCIENETIFML